MKQLRQLLGALLLCASLAGWSWAGSEDVAVTFTYTDANANSVGIAGEFSNWKVVALDRTDGGVWVKKAYLRPGFYGYKFVINETEWVLDPANSVRKVVNDIENSGIAVGGAAPTPDLREGQTIFEFNSPDVQSVHLAGSFNNWLNNDQGKVTGNEQWLLRKDDAGKWRLAASIPPGKHEFKYVIDGGARWETDPGKPVAANGNSVIEVAGGGTVFTLDDSGAQAVFVAGEFNDWNSTAAPLSKGSDGKWRVTVQLKPGTYQYKFVVDGNWKTDPGNTETAPDGLGGQNSVKVVP